MINQASALFYCCAASVGLLVVFLLLTASDSVKNWLYKEVCFNNPAGTDIYNSNYVWTSNCCINGQITTLTEGSECHSLQPIITNPIDNKQILAKSLSFVPTIAYCNMFAIFYLEIISTTKLVSGKTKSDSKLGWQVNGVISLFYFALFATLLIVQGLAPPNVVAV